MEKVLSDLLTKDDRHCIAELAILGCCGSSQPPVIWEALDSPILFDAERPQFLRMC